MLKDKVNIQVLKVDRSLITLFKPFFRRKEIKSSVMSIFFDILVRKASYRLQIDQSHGENRLSHVIILHILRKPNSLIAKYRIADFDKSSSRYHKTQVSNNKTQQQINIFTFRLSK